MITPAADKVWHGMGRWISVKMMKLDQQLRPELRYDSFRTHKNFVFGSFHVHLKDVGSDQEFLAESIEQNCIDAELLHSLI